jgi:hypothetical protein
MEGYKTEEMVECYVDYVKDGKRIGLPIPLHEGRLRGRGRICQKFFINRDYNLESEAHFSYSVLANYVIEVLLNFLGTK